VINPGSRSEDMPRQGIQPGAKSGKPKVGMHSWPEKQPMCVLRTPLRKLPRYNPIQLIEARQAVSTYRKCWGGGGGGDDNDRSNVGLQFSQGAFLHVCADTGR
jgi:hypothetical protein